MHGQVILVVGDVGDEQGKDYLHQHTSSRMRPRLIT